MDLVNIFQPFDDSADIICADCSDRYDQVKNRYFHAITALTRELHCAYSMLKTYEIEVERMKSTQADLEMKVKLLSLTKQSEEDPREENSSPVIENVNCDEESVSQTDEEIDVISLNECDIRKEPELELVVSDLEVEQEHSLDDGHASPNNATEDNPEPTVAEAQKSFVCTVCQSAFKFVIELNRHLYYFSLKWYLKNNYSPLGYHLGGLRQLICHVKNCGIVLQTTSELEKHMREHMEEPYECTKCYEKFSNYGTDACKHESNCVRSKPYKCAAASCMKMYFSKRTCIRHYNLIHAGRPPYDGLVSNPDGTQTDLRELAEHSKYHSTENQYHCDKCKKTFKTERCLNYHLNTHRQTAIVSKGATRYVNSLKDRRPHVRSGRKEKLIQSDGDAKIKCEQPGCSRQYIHRRDLKRHFFNSHVCRLLLACNDPACEKIHIETSPKWHSSCKGRKRHYEYICGICGKKFVLQASLQRHITSLHANSISLECNSTETPESFTPAQELEKPVNPIHNETLETRKAIYDSYLTACVEENIRQSDWDSSFSAFHKPESRRRSEDKAPQCENCGSNSNIAHSNVRKPSICEENYLSNYTDKVSFMKGVELKQHTASF